MAVLDYTARPDAGSTPRELTIPFELAGLRLDQVLARLMPEHSRSRLKAWIDAGGVTVGGAIIPAKHRLLGGERLLVSPLPELRDTTIEAQHLPLSIVYEDDALLVIDKPAGLVVQCPRSRRGNTLGASEQKYF